MINVIVFNCITEKFNQILIKNKVTKYLVANQVVEKQR